MSGDVIFYYDFSSPYSYLSAFRIDAVLPAGVAWRPVVFGALIGAIGKQSWSLRAGPARDARMHECERRAADLGLSLCWPPDWPFGTYSTLVVRAALAADVHGRLREFSQEAFRRGLGLGEDLREPEVVLDAAAEVGLDPAIIRAQVEDEFIKQQVGDTVAEAVAHGVTGVPTVVVGDELFWGDDRLEDAACAIAG